MKLSNIFKEARMKQGLTVIDVCTIAGISKSYYSKVENNKCGKPQYETALSIAKAVSLDKEIIDSYYNIPIDLHGEIGVVNKNELIEAVTDEKGYILNNTEKEILIDLLSTSINLKKEGFKPKEVIRIMEILQLFISA